MEYLVRCSFIEIYNEEIHDLLSSDVKQKYELKSDKESNVYVKDLHRHPVKTVQQMQDYLARGNSQRSTA